MDESRRLIIAIDGPAGAGKSTIAARLARKLGYVNLESGAMYRALALKAIRNDISFDDESALYQLARGSGILLEPTLSGNRVLLDGLDVTSRVRETDVTEGASRVSVHPAVRQWMVEHQRAMGISGGIVMEGRDIGTKVFPDADVKIFSMPTRSCESSAAWSRIASKALTRSLSQLSCASATSEIEPAPHHHCSQPQMQ